jgi:acyl transferase domain-containing protein/acyl-CoA synthetase (AMP-forming)/AMP-acid ligase II/acyl carrier protein
MNTNQFSSRQLSGYETLVELLQNRAQQHPERVAFTFLVDGELEEVRLTYGALDQQARAIAAELQTCGAKGERALLLHPPSLEFISAFFGCLYAGVMAVPVYPPRINQSLSRFQAIVNDSEATFALTTDAILSNIQQRFSETPELDKLRWLATGKVAEQLAEQWQAPEISRETLAFLQYTSGSTGSPKGVMVSHHNLLLNSADLDQGWDHSSDSVMVTWLPTFHDMGLIYGVLQPLYKGFRCYMMAPVSFLQRPMRWLEAISRYQATHSGGPNFAYELCMSRVTPEQLAMLDLSSWRMALNGAEPLRPDTLSRFAETFQPCGFSLKAFCPGYGLAEATLKVTAVRAKNSPVFLRVDAEALAQDRVVTMIAPEKEVRMLVGCGQTEIDTQIVIVHPEHHTLCASDEVGEIWVAGETVAQGYWRRPEATRETFAARLADTTASVFMRTGDLGFLHEGELYITGRLKDLIIIRGHNHYPQDIEQTVEKSHPALRNSCCAAFAIEVEGEEKLVVVQEVERQYIRRLNVSEVMACIRQAIAEQHELDIYAIALIKTGSIPKTSSGKIQRRTSKERFLNGSLDIVGDWSMNPRTKFEFHLLNAELANLEQQIALKKLQPKNHSNSINSVVSLTNGSTNQPDVETVDQHSTSEHATYPSPVQPSCASGSSHSSASIQSWLINKIAAHLNLNPEDIDIHVPFSHYAINSITAVSLSGELAEWLKRSISPTLLYDYPTTAAVAHYLADQPADSSVHSSASHSIHQTTPGATSDETIAIVGIGCRFPGAPNPDAFWQLLQAGQHAISEVPGDRWDIEAFYAAEPVTPGKMNTRSGGFLPQVDQFDPDFFGISRREAERMDPQQRLLLEVVWEALEQAGQPPTGLAGSQTGVFVGISTSDYARLQFQPAVDIDAYAGTGIASSIAANRLSYLLDLRGPSLAIDTACSSSLVAVHLACQSLQRSECHLAIAGGVNLLITPELTVTFSQARMMAADGYCKTFDAAADGYVRGEGCGIVILKRLSDAQRDGDTILAVVKGSAVNQDGRSNGLTAPNGLAQQAVIRQALSNAGLQPAHISYVEAHGTGTSLGDPIEVDALQTVLKEGRISAPPCAIASVKTNIGHLEAAAGIAGLIKVVLSLQYQEIPAHLHLKQLNPHIQLEHLFIPTQPQPWMRDTQPRRAGVSSFGFGGTNAHVILEEAPVAPVQPESLIERPWHLFTLSAKSESALQVMASQYQDFLTAHPLVPLSDLCFTVNQGRSHFVHRLAIPCDSVKLLRQRLSEALIDQPAIGMVWGQVQGQQQPKVVFLFTGQGSQYLGMGQQLYETQPTFRRTIDRCDTLLRPYLKQSLPSILYASSGASLTLNDTLYTQTTLFAIEYALAELWRSWGVQPAAVMGHSLGEYVAACVAGMLTLEDGIKLVAERACRMQALPQNGMMATVLAHREQVESVLSAYPGVTIAAINTPKHLVISGERETVQAVLKQLKAERIASQPLQVSHAFHSPLIEPMLDGFKQVAQQVQIAALRVPFVANLTGRFHEPGHLPDAEYWCSHARSTVQFAAGIQFLVEQGYDCFLEIGPNPVLLGMGQRCVSQPSLTWLPSLKPKQDWQVLLNTLAALYAKGVTVDWAGFERDYLRSRLSLPTYPFERQSYWLKSSQIASPASSSHPFIGASNGHASEPVHLPLEVDSLHVARQFQPEFWNHARLHLTSTPDSSALQGEIHLLDATGQVVAIASGVQVQQLLRPAPIRLTVAEMVACLQPQIEQLREQSQIRSYEPLLEQLEQLSTAYVFQAFQQLGWKWKLHATFSIASFMEQFGIVPRHQRLLTRLLEMLQEEGMLRQVGAEWSVCRLPAAVSLPQQKQSFLSQYPNATAELSLLDRCGQALAEVLQGVADPLQLLFPGGSVTSAEWLYQNSPLAQFNNQLVQRAITTVVEQLPPNKMLRILEIGAGTGGTTAYVLPKLPAQTEYVFTDISQQFLSKAEQKFCNYPLIQYQRLDVERDPQEQGFSLHQFDIVLAANVLHATHDLRHTLTHVQSLLAPGGLLILIEGTQPQRMLDLIFGLTDGWWRFTDAEVRSTYPLLAPEQWRSLLEDLGFTSSVSLPQSEIDRHHAPKQAVILARSGSITSLKPKVTGDEIKQQTARLSGVAEPEPVEMAEPFTLEGLLTAENKQQFIETYLRQQVSRALKLPLFKLDPQQPLNYLGFDSLMAIELKSRIETELGVSISVAEFLQTSSIVQLALQVWERLMPQLTSPNWEEGTL